ncbi:MAG: phosphohistidine phosphatase SixA [Candidatus Altiarchaeales archaeon A3]|nr:MAG: phosphohistidine phosphatase SixA [Candidatus Altiarchaeales archaeon A3]
MEIYIVRHGEALERDIDELRELSEKGKKQAKKAGEKLKNLNVTVDEIFSSTLTRAIQTAKIIAKELRFEKEIKITGLLNPLANPDEILNHLNYIDKDKILLVGHQPFLGNLLQGFGIFDIEIKKGNLCRIEIKDRKCEKLI